jgi:hypothetical protein
MTTLDGSELGAAKKHPKRRVCHSEARLWPRNLSSCEVIAGHLCRRDFPRAHFALGMTLLDGGELSVGPEALQVDRSYLLFGGLAG